MESFEDVVIVAEGDNGQTLVAAIKALPTPPDIAILDIGMPVMDGYETAAALRNEYPDMKILALTMEDHDASIIRMLKAGANGYVLKDIDPAQLHLAIKHLSTNDYYLTELVTGRLIHKMIHEENVRLSPAELEFLQLCCTEMTYKEIAQKMKASPRTIDGYRETLFDRLKVASRVGLVIYAIRRGLVKV